ncbi:HGxxPAAW family protein [Aeromicrobium sp. CTD01-1L150]|uniref:HGxxPAAW family protein n=1 Tax=Aeromicrobium sp. CTD01-1L150 TaxID=3341830 RepID=UPI0035C1E60A
MSHGSSKASWTAVLLCLAGITIGGVALIPNPNWVLFTIGTVLALASGPVGMVMAAAGLGLDRPGEQAPGDEHHSVVAES